jgi:hypothetical protein
MSISIYLEPIFKVRELVIKLLKDEFGISDIDAQHIFDLYAKPHFEKLKDDIQKG